MSWPDLKKVIVALFTKVDLMQKFQNLMYLHQTGKAIMANLANVNQNMGLQWGDDAVIIYISIWKIYLISRINSLFNEKDLIQILMHGPFYLREKGYYASFDSSWWEKHSGGCNAVWSQYLNPNQKLLQKKKLLVSSGDLKWPEAHLPEVRPGHCFRLNHQQGPKISCFWTFWVIWMAFRGSWNFSHWLNIMGRSAKWPDLRSPI